MRRAALAAVVALAMLPANLFAASITSLPAMVVQKEPAAGAPLQTFFPVLSAMIEHADQNTVHLFVDGRDVTQLASMNGGKLQYIPRDRMSAGWHDVFVEGMGRDGRRFSDSWIFQTVNPDGTWTGAPQMGNFQFLPSGGYSFFPGQFMHFFFIAPGDGFAVLQLCGLGQFPFRHQPFSPVFFVTVAVPVTPFPSFFDCQIAALFTPLDGFNTVLVPLPVGITIFSHHRHHMVPVISGPNVPIDTARTTMPGYRTPPQTTYPVSGAAPISGSSPVSGSHPVSIPYPVSVPRPISMPRPIAMPRPVAVPRPVSLPHAAMPHVVVPHPAVPGHPY